MQMYIGIMSGTSLDGCDVALVDLSAGCNILQHHYIPFSAALQIELLDLQKASHDELHKSAMLANQLSVIYAELIAQLLTKANIKSKDIIAIGCHGQTIRHQPCIQNSAYGYTIQIHNPSLLAELTGIDVIANFREPDIAAGGQGAPLAPAFHAYIFEKLIYNLHKVKDNYEELNVNTQVIICNIGGMSNITALKKNQPVLGMDCGAGNVLLDIWIQKHKQQAYDKDGAWAKSGHLNITLLNQLMSHTYFNEKPPKSIGRELFNLEFIENALNLMHQPIKAEDVQCTLTHFTAKAIVQHIINYTYDNNIQNNIDIKNYLFICGGGAYNTFLLNIIQQYLPNYTVDITDTLGINAQHVECVAFAWLAHQYIHNLPSNVVSVTGASRPKILGALYKHTKHIEYK
jgi:anhydro-N-acetylmuramic acid kinase